MCKHIAITLPAVIMFLMTPLSPSPADELERRFGSKMEREQIQSKYIGLHRELKSRRLLEDIEARVPRFDRVDRGYLEKQYGIRLEPDLASLSIRDLELELRDLGGIVDSMAITYGSDDTKDIFVIPPDVANPTIPFVTMTEVPASHSVAAIVYRSEMTFENNKWTLATTIMTSVMISTLELCEFDRFYGTPTANIAGTGFLVADDVIATAGHIVKWNESGYQDFLESVYFVFGYVMETDEEAKTIFSPNEVYEGAEVLAEHNTPVTDWALIRLEQPVTGRDPLPYRKISKIDNEQGLYMIGHPNGMPLKFTDNAEVLENTACAQFRCDLDTRPFHSGSPVFNTDTDEVEGILVTDLGGSFREYCDCFLTAAFTPQLGFPGAEVTRTTEFAGFLEQPESVEIHCRIPLGHLTTADGDLYLVSGQEETVPYSDLGVWLMVSVDCAMPYYPNPGEAWEIVPTEENTIAMQKVCYP